MNDAIVALLKDPQVQEKVRQVSDEAAGFLRQAVYFYKDRGEDCALFRTAIDLLIVTLSREGKPLEDFIGNGD